jgi:hypothetical protein
MSCKGIKASNNSTDTSTSTNTIEISGGDFKINTADDAIHSDAYVVISGGNFQIDTGDDGVHGDTSLTLGVENGQGPQIVIENSYEGLEAGNVYIYEGTYKVNTSDDGINAAGDSSQGNFNQGGGPGRPGGSGWGTSTSTASYSINIYGGDVYVNANGDGLDSNGNLNLYGGNIVVWGAPAQRDDEPLDCDGTLTIQGATVFGAGSSSMTTTPGSNSQAYVRYTNSGNGGGRPGQSSTSTIAEGKTINVKYNNETVYNVKAIKNVNYVIYSSPEMTSSSGWSITADDSALINPTETPTPDEQEPTATPTPDEQEPTVTPTPDEQEPTVTPTPDDQEPTVTPTPDEQEPTVTPTPDDQEPTVTPTPDGQEPTETPTPGQEEPTVTPTPDQEEPTVAPGQVKGLTATSAVTKVTLKWNKVSDADSYEVLRLSSQTGKYETIATTKKTTYTNTKLTAATAYAYKVRAVKNKTTGKASAIVKVLTKPEKVSGLSLKKKSNTKATIKLNQVSGATYYEIYRKNSSTKKYEIAYKIQGKKLYRYISSTGKYKKIGTVSVSKKGVITGTLTGLNLKAEKNQLYKVKAVKTKSGYTSVSGAFSSAVKVK